MTIEYTLSSEDIIAVGAYTRGVSGINRVSYRLTGILIILFLIISLIQNNTLVFILPTLTILLIMPGNAYGIRRPTLIATIYTAGILVLSVVLYRYSSSVLIDLLPMLILILVLGGFWSFIQRRGLKRLYEKGESIGRKSLTIDEQGIAEKGTSSEKRVLWKGVSKVLQNDSYIFIFISKLSAVVIPKNSFASVEDQQAFFQKTMELWKGVQ